MDSESPETLKELGNDATKRQNYMEAILYYTKAAKIDPGNYVLYSNRSFAFLKAQQYYLALDDANTTIKLNPSWPKGYFRKGEIEFATNNYADALESYKEALKRKPDDINIINAVSQTSREILKERKADQTIPWLGAGIGLVIGVMIVIADAVFTNTPTHPLLMSFATIMVAMFGYAIARFYRSYMKGNQTSLLEPPIDLLGDDTKSSNTAKHKSAPKSTKVQARQRYKNGKL